MTTLNYVIFNVFAESAWGGNPLAIVPNADELSATTMQLIARQFNLSETVFICASSTATAHLRIFTPDHELPFAGHPTIGAAAWLHQNLNLPDDFTLQTNAKAVNINHTNGIYHLTISGYQSQKPSFTTEHIATALNLAPHDVKPTALWMNSGTWQLIVPLASRDAVNRAAPNLHQLLDPAVDAAHLNVYLWCASEDDSSEITSRYFFNHNQAAIEDPGTGSACCNLGAWAHHHHLAPLDWHITQAASIERPNHLYLIVNEAGDISVGGRVTLFSTGVMQF